MPARAEPVASDVRVHDWLSCLQTSLSGHLHMPVTEARASTYACNGSKGTPDMTHGRVVQRERLWVQASPVVSNEGFASRVSGFPSNRRRLLYRH